MGYIKGEVFNISLLELKVPGMIDCSDSSQGIGLKKILTIIAIYLLTIYSNIMIYLETILTSSNAPFAPCGKQQICVPGSGWKKNVYLRSILLLPFQVTLV